MQAISVRHNNMRAFMAAVAILTPLVVLPQIMRSSAGPSIMHGHGYCYLWNASLLTLHVGADGLIALSYLSISVTLAWFVYRLRGSLPFHWMFLAFGTFILACGATHAVEIWTVWAPVFWLAANVKIYLPVASAPAAAEREPTPAPSSGSERILLVEDDAAIRQLCASVLRSRGYGVDEAADGETAVRLVREMGHRVDLLLTDVVLPRMNGHQVAETITALLPSAKVLFMSGYTEDAIVRTGTIDPLVAFLPKPFTPTALIERVRLVLDTPVPKAAG